MKTSGGLPPAIMLTMLTFDPESWAMTRSFQVSPLAFSAFSRTFSAETSAGDDQP